MLSNQNITVKIWLCQRIYENSFPKHFETENKFQTAQKQAFLFLHIAESEAKPLTMLQKMIFYL
jgi:hypothetical protein